MKLLHISLIFTLMLNTHFTSFFAADTIAPPQIADTLGANTGQVPNELVTVSGIDDGQTIATIKSPSLNIDLVPSLAVTYTGKTFSPLLYIHSYSYYIERFDGKGISEIITLNANGTTTLFSPISVKLKLDALVTGNYRVNVAPYFIHKDTDVRYIGGTTSISFSVLNDNQKPIVIKIADVNVTKNFGDIDIPVTILEPDPSDSFTSLVISTNRDDLISHSPDIEFKKIVIDETPQKFTGIVIPKKKIEGFIRIRTLPSVTGEAIVTVNAIGGGKISAPVSFKVNINEDRIVLAPGWNLSSLPIVRSIDNIVDVFNNVEAIYAYQKDKWLLYEPNKDSNTLTKMKDGWGYWIKSPSYQTILFTEGDEYDLFAGGYEEQFAGVWNLLGVGKETTIFIKDTNIWVYRDGKWVNSILNEGDLTLRRGEGFWLKI